MRGTPEKQEIEGIGIGRIIMGSIVAAFGILGWVVALGALCL
jgi:hypothetical protein